VDEGDEPNDPVTRTSAAVEWLELPDGSARQVRMNFGLADSEELYGLGERFTEPGLRERTWDVRVYEEYKEQGARTYLPVPFAISSRAWGVWIESDAPSYLDARGDRAVFTVDRAETGSARALRSHVIVADAPYGVTRSFTHLTGEIALAPTWAFGPWMSANTWNNQEEVERQVARTLAEDVPATVLVIEAWSDESTFYIFNDAEYDPVDGGDGLRLEDFRFGGRWPDPKKMVDWCHEKGVRVLLWQIPVQKRLEEPHAQHDADEAHMLANGYMIHNGDGTPYRNKGWWFTDALVLDATNPDATDWWLDKRRYLFDGLGIDGMKTDGGEHLWGRELVAHNGQTGVELVNRYAQAYVDAYHAFVRERTDGDGLTFSRAGYTGAHRSPAHWAGDENSTWSAYRASIQAGLTAGLAGVSIWGWDIAGFSGEIPTVELYIRSTQMATFCPVMQYHSELHGATECRDRTPWNIAERHRDPRALTVYRAYARLRMRLLDYIAEEAEALAAEGQPLMRYPGLVWPEARERLMADPSTYLFGRDLLVAPVMEKGAQTREVELPPGDWVDLWTGAVFDGDRRVLVPAPLERIPVFVRADSPSRDRLLEAARSFRVA
jgi:alpha-glucosidase (family GH31 glycosyl hydrolase)